VTLAGKALPGRRETQLPLMNRLLWGLTMFDEQQPAVGPEHAPHVPEPARRQGSSRASKE